MASFNRNWTLRYAQRKKRDEEAEGYFAWSLTDLLYRILFPFASLHLSIIIIISFQRFSVKIESRKKKKNTNFRYRTYLILCTYFLYFFSEFYIIRNRHTHKHGLFCSSLSQQSKVLILSLIFLISFLVFSYSLPRSFQAFFYSFLCNYLKVSTVNCVPKCFL